MAFIRDGVSRKAKYDYGLKDIAGKRFGKLIIVGRAGSNKQRQALWFCKCDCGETKVISGATLRRGVTNSCGCLVKEAIISRCLKHKGKGTRLYNIWSGMKGRCLNLNSKDYGNYGGRGITICDEWVNKENGFKNFRIWAMANGYQDVLSIDRIDNDGNYEPSNCRFVKMSKQANNRRNNAYYIYNEITKSLHDWCVYFNVDYSKTREMHRKGKTFNEMFLAGGKSGYTNV